MKVIQITDDNSIGGVNSFVYDLCEAQKRIKDDVLLVCIIDLRDNTGNKQLNKLKKRGIKVRCIGAKSKKDALIYHIKDLHIIIRDFAKGEPCICNLHLKLSVLMGVLATRGIKNVKCVETYHNSYHHYELQYRVLHPWISHYIAISQTCGEEMKKRFHTKDKEMTVIPNGVDREKIRNMAFTKPVKKHDGILLMTVGRLSWEKNIKVAVTGLSELCREDLYYRVIGDGPLMDEIQQATSENKYIEFTGQIPREDVITNLAEADIVIMPSLWEGRSILQLEAMALDKPLILSDVPALREVFNEKKLSDGELYRRCSWGYLVQTNNPESYRKAVIDFTNNYREVTIGMKQVVKMRSQENDMHLVAKQYENVYERQIRTR